MAADRTNRWRRERDLQWMLVKLVFSRLRRMLNRKARTWLSAGALVAIVLLFPIAAFTLPGAIADIDGVTGAERVQDIASVRQAILWIGGGLLAGVTLMFTWRRDSLARDANFTDRYTEAIAQLGHESVAIRLGGVYALERIASDSIRDRQTILDVLASYIRHNSPRGEGGETSNSLSVDLAAAALVLGRITQMSPPTNRVDLAASYLVGANLAGADLARANLAGADLAGADLRGANLTVAKLSDVDLSVANLSFANLAGANLAGADLGYADCTYANLDRADLTAANLVGTHLIDADLNLANLTGSNLTGSDLAHAKNLASATLVGAILESVRLPDGGKPKPPDSASDLPALRP